MPKKKIYIAQVALTDDASKKRWKAGETVKATDFPAAVIENWLELGVLVEKEVTDDSGEE